MRTIQYKGYVAEFEYDDESKLTCGSVANTEPYPIVAFELPEGYDVYREFQISVDVYLESCAEDGLEPLPPLPYASKQQDDALAV
ncbi:MAG: type II toxin-antitoxin system HicB family antitoxin [Chloroflexi bacterium]|nr:type II toxin-antitoxin system HicB family antitoxin [Chloroflexota bacterium]